jgi:hypothetical protein
MTTEKMAVLAAMPRERAAIAVRVKLGDWRNVRAECPQRKHQRQDRRRDQI